MKGALLLLLLCVSAEADDLRYEVNELFQQLKSQLEGQTADMASRLSASEVKMEEFQTKLNESEAKMEEFQKLLQDLQKHKDVELVKDDLANLTDRYNQLQSRYDKTTEQKEQLQTRFDELQSRYDETTDSYKQLNYTCNPVTEEERKKRLKRLCETDGFTYDDLDAVCYYLSTSSVTKTWGESRRFCKTRQADLMIVNSQEKQDLVDLVITSGGAWIGLTDRDREGSYKWVDGTTVTSPTFWYPGHPGNYGENYDCVFYANNGGSNRGWGLDSPCSSSLRWICERVVQ